MSDYVFVKHAQRKLFSFGNLKRNPPANNYFDEVFKDHFIYINIQKIQRIWNLKNSF